MKGYELNDRSQIDPKFRKNKTIAQIVSACPKLAQRSTREYMIMCLRQFSGTCQQNLGLKEARNGRIMFVMFSESVLENENYKLL